MAWRGRSKSTRESTDCISHLSDLELTRHQTMTGNVADKDIISNNERANSTRLGKAPAHSILLCSFMGLARKAVERRRGPEGTLLPGRWGTDQGTRMLAGAAISPLSALLPVVTCFWAALAPSFHWYLLEQHSPRSSLDASFSLPVTFHREADVIRSLQVLILQLFKNKDFKA